MFTLKNLARKGLKENTRVGWCEEGDHLLASGGGFRRLMPASDLPTCTTRQAGVFLLYRTYLWNKQQVMSINLTSYYVIHHAVPLGGRSHTVVFYVIHSQVRYNVYFLGISVPFGGLATFTPGAKWQRYLTRQHGVGCPVLLKSLHSMSPWLYDSRLL